MSDQKKEQPVASKPAETKPNLPEVKNEVLAKKELPPSLQKVYDDSLKKMEVEIRKVLPEHVKVERFLRICQTELKKNPKLLECSQVSFLGSIMLAAQMGLEIGSHLGHCWLIPYTDWKSKKTDCSLQLGYKGLLDLVRRALPGVSFTVENIYRNDTFSLSPFEQDKVNFVPLIDGSPRGEWYVTVAQASFIANGVLTKQIEWMTKEQIMKRRGIAKTKAVWDEWQDEMAKKTVLKALCKLLPLSIEDMRVIAADDRIPTVFTDDKKKLIDNSESIYDLNVEPITTETAEPELNKEEKNAVEKDLFKE